MNSYIFVRFAPAVIVILSLFRADHAHSGGGQLPVSRARGEATSKQILARDGLLTLTFKDIDIRDVLTGISMVTGVSIVADGTVQGRIAFLSLRDVTLEDAIKSLAAAGGFQCHRSGNIFSVGRNLNVKPVTVSYQENKLTLEATRADVKDILHAVGQASGTSFIPAQDVQKLVTVSVKDVPLETAMQALLEANGLRMDKKSDGLFVVEMIKPLPPTPRPATPAKDENKPPIQQTTPPQLPVQRSGKVTLTMENATIGDILSRISELTGATLVFTTVAEDKTRRSVRFVEVPIEDAIATVLAGTNYAYKRIESRKEESSTINNHTDDPPNPQSSSNPEQAPPRFLIGDVSKLDAPEAAPFLSTEIIPIKHLRVTEVATFLSARILKEAVRPLKDQNAVSITGTSEQIERIKDELRSLDTPASQIMIQATVIETTLTSMKDLGIEYLVQNNEIQATGPTGSTLVFRTTGGFGKQFVATLTALIVSGKAKVLANPRIATINGKEASIDITDTRYFRTFGFPSQQIPGSGSGLGAQPPTNVISPFAFGSIQPIDAGIKLRITPWVGADGDILVDVSPEVSSVVGTGPEGLPELNRRTAMTTIRVKNGESILIGGLRQKDESKSVTKPFLLGDIPLIGNLFRRTVKNRRETDLMILITPSLVELNDRDFSK